MENRKLTWMKLYANPQKQGSGLQCFALASASSWEGVYKEVDAPGTRVWAYYGNPPRAQWENLAPHKYQSWDFEIVKISEIPENIQIALLTAAAESGGF